MKHELKIWKQYFDAVADGSKTFEYRFNDRNYHTGDTLLLKEFDLESGKYSGRELEVVVTYTLFVDNYAIMSIKKASNTTSASRETEE